MTKFHFHHQILGSRTGDFEEKHQQPNKKYVEAIGATLLLSELIRLLPDGKHSKGRNTTDYQQWNEASQFLHKVFGIISSGNADISIFLNQEWKENKVWVLLSKKS